ncbi:aldo/keto reductase [Micromonospora sp. WMMD961]|uniref:aldo/keto reductase family protein n=1 Tax=Micromonospora sp. WMMD961 TaxID=3016100 RepID=UPI002417B72D|nr:aldo/keto reductase [Micromonospora sp. WMMD961]MDG4780742.1 aldo/keto reductase [Micromonospora sp. WMMD961]
MPVERIIFGTMTLGYHGRGVRVRDVSTARRMLDQFHSRGYREIDTCYVYGDGSCEQMLGDLRVHDHLEVALRYDPVATPRGHEPEVLRASLSASLKRLRVARADLLYLNLRGRDTRWEDTLRTVHELHEEGLVTEFGLSNIAPEDVAETLAIVAREGWVRPTVYQGLYNAMSRSAEVELLPLLHEQGIRFHAYNPLAGGAFAPGFGDDESVGTGSRFDQGHPQGIEYRRRYWNEPYLQGMHQFRAGCEASGVSPTDAALRWLVHHSHLGAVHGDGIILGASRPEHLVQNLDAVQSAPLSPELLVAIDAASETTRPAWPSMRRA